MAIGRRKLLAGGAALWVAAPAIVTAQSSSKVHVGHGFAMHGEPKYPEPPQHLDYVNPAAPKGGNVRFGTQGTYDSLHPFILKGVPAAGISQLWETLCWQSRDEAFTVYGLIAETIEVPEDRSWTAFTLRPQAKWMDGTPITVDDVIWTFETLKAKGPPMYASYYADVLKAEKFLSAAGSVPFNTRFPAGLSATACGSTPTMSGAIPLFSWIGSAQSTNWRDPGDLAFSLTSEVYDEENDGLVGRCSSHFGKVLRDDYAMNHLDEINQFAGLVSKSETSPVAVFRAHVNRLKSINL